MAGILLVLPDQLWEPTQKYDKIFIIQDPHYFRKYNYHKIKLAYHFATCELWAARWGATIVEADLAAAIIDLHNLHKDHIIHVYESLFRIDLAPWVRVVRAPGFLLSKAECIEYAGDKKIFHMTKDFYKFLKSRHIRWMTADSSDVDNQNGPAGLAGMQLPRVPKFPANEAWTRACGRVAAQYSGNPGVLTREPLYALTRGDAIKAFKHFTAKRLELFGKFQDTILKENHYLYHSVLSPVMNIGLITPHDVLATMHDIWGRLPAPEPEADDGASEKRKSKKPDTPLILMRNSVEAYVRQMGWREYMWMLSVTQPDMRKPNYFASGRRIGANWYTGNTGVIIVDNVIRQVIKTGYTHHIERLMILGAWMLMKGASPHHAFKWFMEMFVDAYEWVMIPNVYGMSQWSVGPMVVLRPYFSSGAYFDRMSDYDRAAKEQWNEGYKTFFKDKGAIIEKQNIYMITQWYLKYKAATTSSR